MKNLGLGSINFGAFPRSGNHTLGKTLSLAFPSTPYYWLGHRITKLMTAPNCAVVVRHPLECIASWMQCSDDSREDGADKLVDWYIRYMDGILKAKDNVIVFTLDDLSRNPYGCAVKFANRFGFPEPEKFDKEDVENWLVVNMPEHFPNAQSGLKSARYETVAEAKDYAKAVERYSMVLSIAERAK